MSVDLPVPESDLRKTVGQLVREARAARGLSIDAAAQRGNTSHTTWRAIERGEDTVRAQSFAAVDEAFELKPGSAHAATQRPDDTMTLADALGCSRRAVEDLLRSSGDRAVLRAVDARRTELDLPWDELWEIVAAKSNYGRAEFQNSGNFAAFGPYFDEIKIRLEALFGWADGSLDAIARGESPHPVPDGAPFAEEVKRRIQARRAQSGYGMRTATSTERSGGTGGATFTGEGRLSGSGLGAAAAAPAPSVEELSAPWSRWGPFPLSAALRQISTAAAVLSLVENPTTRTMEALDRIQQAFRILLEEQDARVTPNFERPT